MNILATHSEVFHKYLPPDGTKSNTHVHRNWDMLIYRVREDEYFTHS